MQRQTAKTGFNTDPRTGFQSGIPKRKEKKSERRFEEIV